MKRAVLSLLAILATTCGGAQPGATPSMTELSSDEVRIWFTSGDETLPIYSVDGAYYLLGTQGRRYEVALANTTDGRLEAVVSVDGRDVVTGDVADFRSQRGYVIMPGEEIYIKGFRSSLNEVAAFRFVRASDSYAARMGDRGNVGVVGVAVFEEAEDAPIAIAGGQEAVSVSRAKAMSEKADLGEGEALGTEYAETIDSAAEIVPFKRRSQHRPAELFAVYYDDRQGLERLGIALPEEARPRAAIAGPNPFPGVPDEHSAFAPAPPGE
jgi:hypothetical protein